MLKLLATSCLVATALSQSYDYEEEEFGFSNAKILKEQRFDAGDGRFGSAFAAEDGTVFREETNADGERIGQYSYIGADGKTITVRYSAGKDGFRILEGAHIPEGATGQQSAPFDPDFAANEAKAQKEAALRRQQQQQFRPQQQFRQEQPQPQPASDFNPFINPADPTHLNPKLNPNAASFRPTGSGQQQSGQRQQQSGPRQQQAGSRPQQFRPRPQQFGTGPQQQNPRQQQQFSRPQSGVPNCANCEGVNPFVNPSDPTHRQQFPYQPSGPAFRQPQQFGSQQQPQQIGPNPNFSFQQRTEIQEQPRQSSFSSPTFRQPSQLPPAFQNQPQKQQQPSPLNNFQGNLNLNRFDTGFNFDFSS